MAEADLYIEDEFPLPSFDVVFGDLNAQRKRRKINPYAISQRAVTICMQSFVYIPQPSKAALFVAQTKSAINGAAPAAAVEEPPTVTTSTNEPGQATALFWDPAPNSASEPAAASSSSSSSSSSSASSSSSQPAAGSEGGSGGGGGAGGAGGGGGSSKSRKSKGDGTTGRWTVEEHARFLEGIMRFGKDWKRVHTLVKTRSLTQLRTHAQKVFRKSGLLKIGVGRDVEEEIRVAEFQNAQDRENGVDGGGWVGAGAGAVAGFESAQQWQESGGGRGDGGGAYEQKERDEDDEDGDGDGGEGEEDKDEEDEEDDERPRQRCRLGDDSNTAGEHTAGTAAADA